MTISEKVARLEGLVDGLGIDGESKEGKILGYVIDILRDIADELAAVNEDIEELGDGLDAVSEDLEDVKDYVFDEDSEEDGEDFRSTRGKEADEDEDEDEDEEFYSAECPNCGAEINIDPDALEDGCVVCPECGEKLEIDLSEDEEDDEDIGEDEDGEDDENVGEENEQD